MKALAENTYPGRGIIVGKSIDNKCVIAYFITARSRNSRNRLIAPDGAGGVRTEAFDPKLVSDPSLIIYSPVRVYDKRVVISNGDQTDTVINYFSKGLDFTDALNTREFEPDAILTPRIAACVELLDGYFTFRMASLYADAAIPPRCLRSYYSYSFIGEGKGKIIQTYSADGTPPSVYKDPPRDIDIEGGIDEFTRRVWLCFDKAKRVSLFVRFIDLSTHKYEDRIINVTEGGLPK